MDEFERAKKVATYLQSFARAQQSDWADLMRGVNPNQGYGHSDEAHKAYNIASSLYDWSDTHWINCELPQNYASASDLRGMLKSSLCLLNHWSAELTEAENTCQRRNLYIETINMVRCSVSKANQGILEALRQLDGAAPTGVVANAFDIMEYLSSIANRFGKILLNLKRRQRSRPALLMGDEYDVQYLFQALLARDIDDIRPEEYGASVAGGSSRIDTYLPDYRCGIEYKMTRPGIDNNSLRKQIADDFVLYGSDDRYESLFVFVHDPQNIISNPVAFERQLSQPQTGLKQVLVCIR